MLCPWSPHLGLQSDPVSSEGVVHTVPCEGPQVTEQSCEELSGLEFSDARDPVQSEAMDSSQRISQPFSMAPLYFYRFSSFL